ncbi:hypothetical protein Tco_1004877 [Tanacetum coccineum]|uniref:Zinc finger, CCHC-type n=1 Tax=Tanacetum coccineum TaxID=301880 RepID=A0ABQ5FE64_9ASTR
MGDENTIRNLGDYYKPSHEDYRNTIELPKGNNVIPLRSDSIRLVQNGYSFNKLWFEDPNQHLKDFLKLVDSLKLDVEYGERMRLQFYHKSRTNFLIEIEEAIEVDGPKFFYGVGVFIVGCSLGLKSTSIPSSFVGLLILFVKLGNSVNTKFARTSILGKPVLQPHRNQSVVRQPTAFKSERPRISKPRFASQVDVNNDLSKPVTTHYLPREREPAVVNPHYVIASNESRNSSKNMPRFSSNDMVHNHYLDEARKKTQANGRNSEPSVMPSSRSQRTTNDCKPKPRSNTQTSRN